MRQRTSEVDRFGAVHFPRQHVSSMLIEGSQINAYVLAVGLKKNLLGEG